MVLWCVGIMRRIFESEKEIQGFINGFCSTNEYYKEAMKTRELIRVCGTLTKRHPSGYYIPVKLKCYLVNDNTEVIPTLISEMGEWGGLMITPDKIQVVAGRDYKESVPNDEIEFSIDFYGQDLTATAKEIIDQCVRKLAMA